MSALVGIAVACGQINLDATLADLGIDDLEHGFMVDTELDPGKDPDHCPSSSGRPTVSALTPDSPAGKALIAASPGASGSSLAAATARLA